MKEFMEMLEAPVSLISGYYTGANGQVERVNLVTFLKAYCSKNLIDSLHGWNIFWISPDHSCTNLTPFLCVLGFWPLLFLWNASPTAAPAVNHWLNNSTYEISLIRTWISSPTVINNALTSREENPLFTVLEDHRRLATKNIKKLPMCKQP